MNLREAARAAKSTQVLDKVAADRSALLLIHWQEDIVRPGGHYARHFGQTVKESDVLLRTREILDLAHEVGMHIVYVNVVFQPDDGDIWPNSPVLAYALEGSGLRRGHPGAQVVPELGVTEHDLVVEHARISAFSGTALDVWLRARDVNTVFVSGVATNVAVEGTARSAIDLGYWTLVIEDCCTAATPEAHAASIEQQRVIVSQVLTSTDLLEMRGRWLSESEG